LEGIGRATVKLLAKCGANIVALSRTRSDLDSLKTEVSSNKLHDALVNSPKILITTLEQTSIVIFRNDSGTDEIHASCSRPDETG
jgi:L-xylulose reductase